MRVRVIDVPVSGKHIKYLCEKQGLSAERIKDLLGLGCVQTVYKWYAGRTLPSIDNLVMLEDILNVPMSDILVYKEIDAGD